jgi:hypothetical protein
MENGNRTVWVETLTDLPAVKMIWKRQVHSPDVSAAFQEIDKCLTRSKEPQYVIVDITSNPNFPIFETVIHCAVGPFRNPMLHEWLIVGENAGAKRIENLLSRMTGRSNVRWFNCEEQAIAYLRGERLTAKAI